MPSFGEVALPDINPLAAFYAAGDAENRVAAGRLRNQLATNTLASETQTAANVAESGSLANRQATQLNPLEIMSRRQQLGLDASPALDGLTKLIGGGQPPAPGAASDGAAPADRQSLLTGPMPISADPQTQHAVGAEASAQGVNPQWAMRVHHAESGGSKEPFGQGSASPAGAIGPMQLTSGTASDLGVDPNDFTGNIKGGVKYLAQLKQRYDSPVLATAAYNAGPGRVDAFLAGTGTLPPETVAYVGKVFGTDGRNILQSALSGAHGHNIPGMAASPQQDALPAPVQVAGPGAPTGSLPTSQPVSASPSPGTQGVDDVMARLRAGQGAPDATASGSSIPGPEPSQPPPGYLTAPASGPPIPNQHPLFSLGTSGGAMPSVSQNTLAGPPPQQPQLMPSASAAPPAPAQPATPPAPAATGMNSPQVQQALALQQKAADIEMYAARYPNNPQVQKTAAAAVEQLKARAAVIMQADSVTVDPVSGLQTSSLTGKVGSAAVPLANYQPDPNNPGILISPGQKPVVLPPGRATTLPDGSTWVTGPGGTFKQAREANLEGASAAAAAAAGGKAAADSAAKTKDALIPLARTSVQAISNIDYGLHQLDEAAKGGIPTGYFAPALATAAAAVKSLGYKIPGVDPSAVSDIQTASKTLAVVSGAILQNIIGKGEITEGKIEAFIHAQPGIMNDPLATHRILNWARSQFTYDHEMAMDGLANVDPKSGQLAAGWQAGYITKHGAGPIFDSASGEMKQPDGQAPGREPPVEAKPQGAHPNVSSAADHQNLAPGATYIDPAGNTRKRR